MSAEEKKLSFSKRPSMNQKARRYDILRVGKSGAGNLVLLGEQFLWHPLHFWHGRTTPCFGEDCEPCFKNCQVRERGYMAITPDQKLDVMILEVTENCADKIDELQAMRKTLRGCLVNLSRSGKRANGKLNLHATTKVLPEGPLPTSPDVAEVMRRIWGQAKHGQTEAIIERGRSLTELREAVAARGGNGVAK